MRLQQANKYTIYEHCQQMKKIFVQDLETGRKVSRCIVK